MEEIKAVALALLVRMGTRRWEDLTDEEVSAVGPWLKDTLPENPVAALTSKFETKSPADILKVVAKTRDGEVLSQAVMALLGRCEEAHGYR